MQATISPSQLLVPAFLVAVASISSGCVPRSGETTDDMTTVLTDSDSDSEATTDDTAPTTLGTTTSTVTTEPLTTSEVSSTTGSDTDTTTGDSDTSTTEDPICDYDGVCDDDEHVADCLHDCGGCEPDGVCDGAFENPFACPSDCPATDCDGDGSVDALGEQCDDGNADDDDACTATCDLNVCGDGFLYSTENGGTEECDDGNLDDGDGCTSKCEREVRRVFLSSVSFSGDFSPKIGQFEGVQQADAQCQLLADDADLSGLFMAWLSQGETAPKNRFGVDEGFLGRYELSNGVVVAESWADLTSGELLSEIRTSETGEDLAISLVWTNTTKTGSSKGSFDCAGWSSADPEDSGAYGSSKYKDARWTDSNSLVPCTSTARVYCVQVE